MEHMSTGNETITVFTNCIKDSIVKFVTEFMALFYIISPTGATWENAYDVPDYEVLVSDYNSHLYHTYQG